MTSQISEESYQYFPSLARSLSVVESSKRTRGVEKGWSPRFKKQSSPKAEHHIERHRIPKGCSIVSVSILGDRWCQRFLDLQPYCRRRIQPPLAIFLQTSAQQSADRFKTCANRVAERKRGNNWG